MRSTGRAARLIFALAIGFGPAACGTAPGPSSTPSPATAPPSSPSPAATGSLAPPPTPTPTPPPTGLAEWRQLPPQDGLRDAEFVSVAYIGDRFLGLGCVIQGQEGCVRPAIWESRDGLEWQMSGPVFLPPNLSSGTVVTVAASQIGTVAAGNVRQGDRTHASIWLRAAEGWAQVTPQAASDSTVHALLATDRRVFAVGSGAFMEAAGFRAWWSGDGTTWQAAPSPADEMGGYPTGLLPVDGALLAWGPSCGGVCVPTTAWWRTVDGTAWQPVDPPRGLVGASVSAIGRTESGFEAFGSLEGGALPIRPAAWAADETATDWRSVEPPPESEAAAVFQQLIVGRGSVVAGDGGGTTGLAGFIWLRGPGESTWRAPMQVALPDGDVDLVALIQSPQQLNRIIVIGRTFEGLQEHLVIWTGLVDWAP